MESSSSLHYVNQTATVHDIYTEHHRSSRSEKVANTKIDTSIEKKYLTIKIKYTWGLVSELENIAVATVMPCWKTIVLKYYKRFTSAI